ncbi:MAG: 2-succinyl-5-enolpyruvyl-6-hydroxy-3-cyclohexene-1-carboxylic-acid synthase, partial [Cyclobacteriaceae bacterium]
ARYTYRKILIVAGQLEHDKTLIPILQRTARQIPVISGILSNLHEVSGAIRYADAILSSLSEEKNRNLKPDLLISFGKSVISKSLKNFLRKFPDIPHWHIQSHHGATDPFKNLTKVLVAEPAAFFSILNDFDLGIDKHYVQLWSTEDRGIAHSINTFFPQPELGELELVKNIMDRLPSPCNLHLANSMSVRYAEYLGLATDREHIAVFSNRGTSGIDGCTSTAIGHSLSSEVINILITGDLAFFYDRNAFWHNYPLANLRIVLLNNHGGVIFKLIDGPAQLPEADDYFVTRQTLTAKNLCSEFGFDYLPVTSLKSLPAVLDDFFSAGNRTKILELESSIELNKTLFERFKKNISQHP